MLIKIIVIAAASIGTITFVVVNDRDSAALRQPPPAVLRQATPAERQLLDSMTTVAPKQQGGMH